MHLLNQETDILWEVLATTNAPLLTDLSAIVMKPDGSTQFIENPFTLADYTAPTDLTAGSLAWKITPTIEGMWKVRLVAGVADNYLILSKVELYVHDNTTVTVPYNENIGKTLPYDISFYMQGYLVPNELFGVFTAVRPMKLLSTNENHVAHTEAAAHFLETTLDILHNDTPVGTVVFSVLDPVGVVTLPHILLGRGEQLKVKSGSLLDEQLRDISISLSALCTVLES